MSKLAKRACVDVERIAGAWILDHDGGGLSCGGVVLAQDDLPSPPRVIKAMQNQVIQAGQSPAVTVQKSIEAGAGAGWRVGVALVERWPEWTAYAVKMLEPLRGGRGDIGAGGGRGVLVKCGGKVKRVSTAGGAVVTATLTQRLGSQLLDRTAGWRVPFGSFVEPSVVAPLFGGLPAGGLFGELQGQMDLTLCSRLAGRLAASMRRDGRPMSDTSKDDGVGAGVLAIARWRAINARHLGARIRGAAASVAWRAIVKSVSADGLGESQSAGAFCDADFSNLASSALPLPPLCGDDSDADRASRLLFERSRAKRPALLRRRIESIAVAGGANGERRKAAAERVGYAVRRLLGGDSLEQAATAAGWSSSGVGRHRKTAGDALIQAARRLGFNVQFSLRVRGRNIAMPSLG